MTPTDSRVTIHMAGSLDGFVARRDGRVDWLDTVDEFEDGETLEEADATAFVETIDCYVMGSRTYETAVRFETQGVGWAYGDKPTIVLTSRNLSKSRESIQFHSGDLTHLVNEVLRPTYRNIWIVGGPLLSAEFLRLELADEVRYSVLPILIGEGIPFVEKIGRDVALHLVEVKAYKSGIVELRYEVPGPRGP